MRRLLFLVPLVLVGLAAAGCVDGDIRTGCKRWCHCHHGSQSESSCFDACEDTLKTLKRHDRTRARQVADCLAAKGDRKCGEITLCGQGVLSPPARPSTP